MSKEALINYHYDALDRVISFVRGNQTSVERFYSDEEVSTHIQGNESTVFLSHENQVFSHANLQQRTATLLGINQQGTVLHSLTNGSLQPLQYTPYGHSARNEGLHSLLGFNGEQPDPVTGCYFLGNGYRAYNPVLMRFHSPDSMSPFGAGGINPYAYCVGDPINLTDPTGHFSWRSVFKIAVAVVAIAVAVATLVVAPVSGVVAVGAIADIVSSALDIGSIVAGELAPESEVGTALGQFSLAIGLFSLAAGRGIFGKSKVPTTLLRRGALKVSNGPALRSIKGAANLGRQSRNTVAAANNLEQIKKGLGYLKYAGYGVTAIGGVEDYVIPYFTPPQADRSGASTSTNEGGQSPSDLSFSGLEQRGQDIRSID